MIIAVSGKMGAGKTTICDYAVAFPNDVFRGLIPEHAPWTKPKVKRFSFAYRLKMICVEILGLPHEWVFDTQAHKEELTTVLWENMPHYAEIAGRNPMSPARGPMTVREVIQEVGTGIFRKIYGDVWVNACLYDINAFLKEGGQVALIDDMRFPNEAEGIKKAGGQLLRLNRPGTQEGNHESETALDDYLGFDHVLVNNGSQDDLKKKFARWANRLKG